jgi:hypothetical protein
MAGTASVEQSGSCTEPSFDGSTPVLASRGEPPSALPEPPWLDVPPLLEGLPLPVDDPSPLEGLPLSVEGVPLPGGALLPVEVLPLLEGALLPVEVLPLPGRPVLPEAPVLLPRLLPPERVSPELDDEPLSFSGPIGPATAPLHPDPNPPHTVSDKSATQDNVDFILNLTARTVLRPRPRTPGNRVMSAVSSWVNRDRAAMVDRRGRSGADRVRAVRAVRALAVGPVPVGIAFDGIAVDGIRATPEWRMRIAVWLDRGSTVAPGERRGPGRCGSDGLAVGYRDATGL